MDGDTLNGGEGLAYEPGMQSEKMELTDAELGGKGEPSTEMNGVGGIENPAFSVSESDEIIDTSRNRPNTANTDKEDIERRAPSVKRVIIIEKDVQEFLSDTTLSDSERQSEVTVTEHTVVKEGTGLESPAEYTVVKAVTPPESPTLLPSVTALSNGTKHDGEVVTSISNANESPAILEVETLQTDKAQVDKTITDINVPVAESEKTTEEIEMTANRSENSSSKWVHFTGIASQVSVQGDLAPGDDFLCWRADGAVKLRMTDHGPASETPVTVPTLLISTARHHPNIVAMASKVNKQWVKWTYAQYLMDVRTIAKAFIELGLKPFHSVGILGFNSPEWFISDVAAIFAGGLAVGIYTTNSSEAVGYVARHSRANILVVDTAAQLDKVLAVRDSLPELKAIIQYKGTPKEKTEGVYTWTEVAEMGRQVADSILDDRLLNLSPNRACSVIYTSGTTGQPKGVLLSHDNISWTARMSIQHCKFRWANETAVSYLPLSHIAASLSDIFMSLSGAFTVYFAQPDALKGTLGDTLREVRPTLLLAVPRVWEKMHEKLLAVGRTTKGCKKKIATWAKGVGLRGNLAAMEGQRKPATFGLANALVFKKVKKAMGLDRCWAFYSGAAPISLEILEYFMSLNIVITELYGMSELTGPQTVAVPWSFLIGTVGFTLCGVETLIHNKDEEGNGEICMRGRHVFMGYLDDEAKTRDIVDEEGFLHSGDIGRFDPSGTYLYITGRIKELIITAGGENVAPVLIEDNVKAALPCVGDCMLIGDKRKFLSILLTVKCVVDAETMIPGDKLDPATISWCRGVGSNATMMADILDMTDENVMQAIQKGITLANTKAISRAQMIQKWTVLPKQFSIPGGELGPTLKLKRSVVLKKYHNTIEAFYTDK